MSLEDGFLANIVLVNYHYQAKNDMSDCAVVVGFLMLWLKRYVVITPPHHAITMDMVVPLIQLACRVWVALLPAIIANVQNQIRTIISTFYNVPRSSPDLDGLHLPNGMAFVAQYSFLRRFRYIHATSRWVHVDKFFHVVDSTKVDGSDLLLRLQVLPQVS